MSRDYNYGLLLLSEKKIKKKNETLPHSKSRIIDKIKKTSNVTTVFVLHDTSIIE